MPTSGQQVFDGSPWRAGARAGVAQAQHHLRVPYQSELAGQPTTRPRPIEDLPEG